MTEKVFVVPDYLKFRADLRGFDLLLIEQVIRHDSERYYDVETQRVIVVGEHGNKLVMIPYHETETELIPSQYIQHRVNKSNLD